jgi:hypothetical protein
MSSKSCDCCGFSYDDDNSSSSSGCPSCEISNQENKLILAINQLQNDHHQQHHDEHEKEDDEEEDHFIMNDNDSPNHHINFKNQPNTYKQNADYIGKGRTN